MKLKEYLEHLNKMVKDNPELLNKKIVYSIDDEGNAYKEVLYEPSLGDWDEHKDSICIN